MDQIISVIRRCLPFCFPLPEIESEDHNEASQVVGVEGQNEDVQSNTIITRITSSSSQSGWDHDVFLSFRGEDTRKNFTDHLYNALDRVGIRTFRDDEGLDRGEIISSELLNAIRRSRISIVVFSEGYASSRWCLDELAEIVNCKNTIGHTLLPIFYHVDPSDVRKQTKTFAEAFIGHEKRFHMESVQRWREALTQAANCSDWNLANEYESQVIDKIVEEVLCKVNPAHLDVAIHPVGIQSCVKHIKALLNLEINDVRIVGFYGMGGIGKTTLAKAVYNEICHGFQGSSFLFNVKEKSKESNGLIHLQKQLLYDILHKENWNVSNVARGITLIKERIQGKKVLVVLDDVDHLDQLHALIGFNFKLFRPGSRLIATTRDEQLLDLLKVDEKYKVNKLNHWESLQLFKWHAFQMTHPIKEHLELSVSVVKYTGGLPLALVVLGSSLFGKSVAEWRSKLEKLQKIPDGEIKKKLETSLDSLEFQTREMFLDIACFFIGMEKEYVIEILLARDFPAVDGLGILIQRSLVTIECNELRMHDLIRDMGRGIVYAESPRHPGRRSRLWFPKDIANVLLNNTGSKKVEGLILNLPELDDVDWKTKAFKKMANLRLLQINDVHLKGSYEHLSKALKSLKLLKWLCWHECPLKSVPHDFHLKNLVILDMQRSKVKEVWKTKKIFNNLKVLNLSNSKSLTRSPDFSQVPQLEILILKGCTNLKVLPNFLTTPHLKSMNLEGCTSLVEIHESIGLQTRLVLLNLQGCENLRNLPSCISYLKSLKTLVLSKCFGLAKLPKQLESMAALTKLYMENTGIEQLPSSFHFLSNLETLSFRGCECLIESPKFVRTSRLKQLILDGCTGLVEIDESIGFLKRLSWLSLESCKKLRNIPSSISNLESLEILFLGKCYKLEELPEQFGNMTALKVLCMSRTAIKQLPSSFNLLKNLVKVSFFGCEYLIKSPEFSETLSLSGLTFEGCTSLVEIHESIGHLKCLCSLNLSGCKKLRSLPISIFNLENTRIALSNYQKLDKLSEKCENLKDLKEFAAYRICDGTASFSDLVLLGKSLSVGGRTSSRISPNSSNNMNSVSIFKFFSLIMLDLSNRNLSEDSFPIGSECVHSLKILKLSRNNFRNLPSFIGCLPNLISLDLSECTRLQSISLAGGVIVFLANDCTSLERISFRTNEKLRSWRCKEWSEFNLNNCRKLVEIQNLEWLECVPKIFLMGNCNNLSSESKNSVLQMMCRDWKDSYSICSLSRYGIHPGSEIPNWISHQAMGSSVSFRRPPFLDGNKISQVVLCFVYVANKKAQALSDEYWGLRWKLCNKSSRDQSNDWYNLVGAFEAITRALDFDVFEDHICAQVIPKWDWRDAFRYYQMNSEDEIEVAIDLYKRFPGDKCGIDPQIVEVKRCGIHFLLDGDEPSVSDDDLISESESENEDDSRL